MGGHRHRQVGQRNECGKIRCLEHRPVGSDHRQLLVAVDPGAAVPRNVLENRQNAARLQPLGNRFGYGGDFAGLVAVSTVSHNRVGIANWDVGERQAIDVDAKIEKVGGHEARPEPRRGKAQLSVSIICRSVRGPRRINRPMRRSEALHAATLLINQDRRAPAEHIAHLVNRDRAAVAATRRCDGTR